MSTFAEYEQALFAICIWREAGGEGAVGMRAVAHVILNRIAAPDFPNTFSEVICGKNQFSAMSVKGDAMTVRWPSRIEPTFAVALTIAGQFYKGRPEPDPTKGATFYRNPATATSGWYVKNIVNSPLYQLNATIGHHEFHGRAV